MALLLWRRKYLTALFCRGRGPFVFRGGLRHLLSGARHAGGTRRRPLLVPAVALVQLRDHEFRHDLPVSRAGQASFRVGVAHRAVVDRLPASGAELRRAAGRDCDQARDGQLPRRDGAHPVCRVRDRHCSQPASSWRGTHQRTVAAVRRLLRAVCLGVLPARHRHPPDGDPAAHR